MTGSRFRIAQAALTDVGRVRKANEDAVIARPECEFWAVADGMGGHQHGSWASSTIVEALREAAMSGDFEPDAETVAAAIHQANRCIFEASSANGRPAGSTVVALLMRDERFAAFWAGDSRVYLRRDSELYRLTEDHTQVQEMVGSGYLTPEEAAKHPMAHVLSRAVGAEKELQLDAVTDTVQAGDVFLLCSDGLYGVVSDQEIFDHMDAEPALAVQRLVEACLARGAPDNVSVIVVACQEPTSRILAPLRAMS